MKQKMEPISYSSKVLELRKRAKSLGITDKEINNCGNDEECLKNKIAEKEAEMKKRQEEEIKNSHFSSMNL